PTGDRPRPPHHAGPGPMCVLARAGFGARWSSAGCGRDGPATKIGPPTRVVKIVVRPTADPPRREDRRAQKCGLWRHFPPRRSSRPPRSALPTTTIITTGHGCSARPLTPTRPGPSGPTHSPLRLMVGWFWAL